MQSFGEGIAILYKKREGDITSLPWDPVKKKTERGEFCFPHLRVGNLKREG